MEGRDFLRNFLELHGLEMDEIRQREEREEMEENVSGYFQTVEEVEGEEGEEGEGEMDHDSSPTHNGSSQTHEPSLAKGIGLALVKLVFVLLVGGFLTVRLFAPKHEERLPFLAQIDLSNQ